MANFRFVKIVDSSCVSFLEEICQYACQKGLWSVFILKVQHSATISFERISFQLNYYLYKFSNLKT